MAKEADSKGQHARRKAAICAAFACYWACIFSTIMSPSLVAAFSPDEGQVIRIIAAFGIAAGLLLQFATSQRLAIANSKLLSAVVIVFPLLFCGLQLFAPHVLNIALWGVLAFACCATSSLLLCNICAFVATFSQRDGIVITCLASSIGAIAAVLIELLDPAYTPGFIAVLTPIAVALLWFARIRRQFGDEKPAREVVVGMKNYRTLLGYMFLYSTSFGLMVNAATSSPTEEGTRAFLIAIAIPGILLLVLLLAGKQRFDLEYFMRLLAGILIIGLVPLIVLDGTAQFVCILVLVVAFGLFDISSIISLIEIIRENELPHLSTFAFGRFFAELGIPTGWTLGLILCSAFPGYEHANIIAAFCVAGIMVLMLALTSKRNTDTYASSNNVGQGPNQNNPYLDFPHAVSQIAQEYALSDRETEVFELLARGRTPKRISEILVVSESTAKSHAYRIYQKLGIHSQQDLIDIVEQRQQELSSNRWQLMK